MPTIADPAALLRSLFDTAVQAAQPHHKTAAFLPAPPRGRTLVLGAGKAAGAMAQAVEALWPADAPLSGLVVTRYGHTPSRPSGLAQRIEVLEASHPVPDAAGEQAAQRILALTQGLTADDLVLCLMSGGASALLTLPHRGRRQYLRAGAGHRAALRHCATASRAGRLGQRRAGKPQAARRCV